MHVQLSIPSPNQPSTWAPHGPLNLRLVTHNYRKIRILTLFVLRRAQVPHSITLHAHIPLSNTRPTQNVHAGLQPPATTQELNFETNYATLSLLLPPQAIKLNLTLKLDHLTEKPSPSLSPITYVTKKEEKSPPFTLANLLREPDFTDVTLRVGNPVRQIHAHAAVLALSSPVFRAMLLTDMAERRTRIVRLVEFSIDTIEVALRFVYGERTSVPPPLVMEVYRFAHQYDIEALLMATRETLKALVEEASDAVALLQFACLYEDRVLRETARGIVAREFGSLLAVPEVKSIPTEVFYELLESDDVRGMEMDVLLVGLKWMAERGEDYLEGVLRRVRWGLMDDGMLEEGKRIVSDIAPRLANQIKDVQSTNRVFGRPACTMLVPVVRAPPKLKGARLTYGESAENSFEWKGLTWRMRVSVVWCSGCTVPQVGVSFWLEEEEDGGVRLGGQGVLPLRVVARCAVWGDGVCLGGRKFAVVLTKGGWACGWGVRDVVERERWECDAVKVSLEITEIERL